MSKSLTNPCFCWLVIVVVIDNDVEDDQHQHHQGEVESSEGHQAAELAIVNHKHEGGKHEDFGDTVKGGLEQKQYYVCGWQRVFLGPVSKKSMK